LCWSHEFSKAAKVYQRLLDGAPNDDELSKRLAETLLFDRQYPSAVERYATLLARYPERQDIRNGFLMAAAGSPSLREVDRETLEGLYRQQYSQKNVAYLTRLLNAVSKHGKPEQAVALLETLVERAPSDPDLRVRLADTLYNLGRFNEADLQYRWLLDNALPQASAKSPSVTPVEARR
jgi:predicted Zn-dependent protease